MSVDHVFYKKTAIKLTLKYNKGVFKNFGFSFMPCIIKLWKFCSKIVLLYVYIYIMKIIFSETQSFTYTLFHLQCTMYIVASICIYRIALCMAII